MFLRGNLVMLVGNMRDWWILTTRIRCGAIFVAMKVLEESFLSSNTLLKMQVLCLNAPRPHKKLKKHA
ncbi:unnamed protein product [Linum tenue]|uniref:Uncharacterized protein n=1 Tax=Linum tenue TaxID=586396 RepID=A0AAV0P2K1_9ROSI|nr:unnamed protein product [Linum tenue]